MEKSNRVYISDGVHVSWDGAFVTLAVNNEIDDQETIYLDISTLDAFTGWLQRIGYKFPKEKSNVET